MRLSIIIPRLFEAAILICVLCLLYGFFIEPKMLKTRHVTVGEGEGVLKIALISDIHIAGFHVPAERVEKIVARVNALDADMIFIAGDFVSGHVRREDQTPEFNAEFQAGLENLAALKASSGVYAVLGNHEIFYSEAFVRTHLTKSDITVLENETTLVPNINGAPEFCIAGFSDYSLAVNRDKTVMKKCPADLPALAIMHSPDSFQFLRPGTALAVAGHTHGGQINLPFIGRAVTFTNLGKDYAYGLKDWRGTPVFVSSGIGTSKMAARFRSAPEIVMIDFAYSQP